MEKRNLSLNARVESVRNPNKVILPVHFSLPEIKSHFNDSMEEIKLQFNVADVLFSGENEKGGKMVLRSMVVLSEGLLDFYIHEVSKYCLFQMFCGNWKKSEKYSSFMVPMSKVDEAFSAKGSNEWFFGFLNDKFSRDVFLSFKLMNEQLNLAGLDFGTVMMKAFPKKTVNEAASYGKDVVMKLFIRRNEIAHQNDRSHFDAQQNDIDAAFVKEYISCVEQIVNAIHDTAMEKDSG